MTAPPPPPPRHIGNARADSTSSPDPEAVAHARSRRRIRPRGTHARPRRTPNPRSIRRSAPRLRPSRRGRRWRRVPRTSSNALGFQANQETSNVSGNIGKRGDANVDSAATPVGRYQEPWSSKRSARSGYTYFYARSDLVSLGMVRIHIDMDRSRQGAHAAHAVQQLERGAGHRFTPGASPTRPSPRCRRKQSPTLQGRELSMDLTFNAE